MHSAIWSGQPERLDKVLTELGLLRSRSRAQAFIAQQFVRVNGETVIKPSFQVAPNSSLTILSEDVYVSRAAHKLIAALDQFSLDPSNAIALDVGASTGGFTQVLLERGARMVVAVDVGHDQMAQQIRSDPRVVVIERFNARELSPELLTQLSGIPEQPTFIVADISFISLELVLPALTLVAAEDATFVLLIKPQFEVGRSGVKSGVVVDSELALAAVRAVVESAQRLGLNCLGLTESPITGEHGNREVLAVFTGVNDHSQNTSEWLLNLQEIFNHPFNDRGAK